MCELCASISDAATDYTISFKMGGGWDKPATFAGVSKEAALVDAGMMTMLNGLITDLGPFGSLVSEYGSELVKAFRTTVTDVKAEEALSDEAIFKFLDSESL